MEHEKRVEEVDVSKRTIVVLVILTVLVSLVSMGAMLSEMSKIQSVHYDETETEASVSLNILPPQKQGPSYDSAEASVGLNIREAPLE
ncbi:MAG: hypothetical protein V1659_02630 [Candidatus Woesearchaeota archaeon]